MPTEDEVERKRKGHGFVPVGLWPNGLCDRLYNQTGARGGPCTSGVWMVADGRLWWGDFSPVLGEDSSILKTAHMQLHHALPSKVQGRVECAGSILDGELRYNSLYNCDELRIWCCRKYLEEIDLLRVPKSEVDAVLARVRETGGVREALIERFEQCRKALRDQIMETDYNKECSEEDKIIVQRLWYERIKVP